MKLLAGTILSLFLVLMFMSLFHLSGAMDRSHSMRGCPVMEHEGVICPMSPMDHIGVWKSVFFNLIPSVFTLLLSLGVTLLVAATAPHLLKRRLRQTIPIYWAQLRNKTYTYTVRPLQDLFSSGILHPKLF